MSERALLCMCVYALASRDLLPRSPVQAGHVHLGTSGAGMAELAATGSTTRYKNNIQPVNKNPRTLPRGFRPTTYVILE